MFGKCTPYGLCAPVFSCVHNCLSRSHKLKQREWASKHKNLQTHTIANASRDAIASRSRNLIDSVYLGWLCEQKKKQTKRRRRRNKETKKRVHHYTGINLHLLIKLKFFTVLFPHPPPSSIATPPTLFHHLGFFSFFSLWFSCLILPFGLFPLNSSHLANDATKKNRMRIRVSVSTYARRIQRLHTCAYEINLWIEWMSANTAHIPKMRWIENVILKFMHLHFSEPNRSIVYSLCCRCRSLLLLLFLSYHLFVQLFSYSISCDTVAMCLCAFSISGRLYGVFYSLCL